MTQRTWILLADRRKARIFLHKGEGAALEDALDHQMEFAAVASPSSPPTRSGSSGGAGHHNVAMKTSQEEGDRDVASRSIAEALHKGEVARAYDQLVIAAPPDLLGAIREHLPKEVQRRVVAEIGARLVDLPVNEIAERLTAEKVMGQVASKA